MHWQSDCQRNRFSGRAELRRCELVHGRESVPMDRLNQRLLACCGLSVILAAAGCRSTRSEVPPGRQYTNDGRQIPTIGFSSDPHAPQSPTFAGNVPGTGPGAMSGALGGPTPNASAFGVPTNHAYGPPETASIPSSPGSLTSPSFGSIGGASALPRPGGTATAGAATLDPGTSPASIPMPSSSGTSSSPSTPQ
jgi:hypothetical protein